MRERRPRCSATTQSDTCALDHLRATVPLPRTRDHWESREFLLMLPATVDLRCAAGRSGDRNDLPLIDRRYTALARKLPRRFCAAWCTSVGRAAQVWEPYTFHQLARKRCVLAVQ